MAPYAARSIRIRGMPATAKRVYCAKYRSLRLQFVAHALLRHVDGCKVIYERSLSKAEINNPIESQPIKPMVNRKEFA